MSDNFKSDSDSCAVPNPKRNGPLIYPSTAVAGRQFACPILIDQLRGIRINCSRCKLASAPSSRVSLGADRQRQENPSAPRRTRDNGDSINKRPIRAFDWAATPIMPNEA